ncbi:hypothetical protein [Adonisia turfae]|uniref:Uncharacterized protein n=1 Tax=Adonisia turfae CCMR0081 TaxID=2292702 RepID=A0A6M0RRH0_9CYAN|nr:hypothetical protein [Adonisia turfae]NEZ58766.1 hypothetical protein [Adonisia turfae CCMR0081]
MMPSPYDDDFRFFPYPAEHSNSRTNNGGINLVQEPHRINEITEAVRFPELRALLVEVNGEGSPFMTLGCAAATEKQSFLGYIEFSVRPEYAENSSHLLNLDSQFAALMKQVGSPETDWENYCDLTLKWESAVFAFRETPDVTQHKVTVWYKFNNLQEAATFISAFHVFLIDYANISDSEP